MRVEAIYPKPTWLWPGEKGAAGPVRGLFHSQQYQRYQASRKSAKMELNSFFAEKSFSYLPKEKTHKENLDDRPLRGLG